MSKFSEVYCRMCEKGDAARDKGLVTPDDVVRYDNISYGEDPVWNLLDVYRPKQIRDPADVSGTQMVSAEGQKLPVIVSVHGGGWVYGSKEVYQFYCMSLAERGFAVVNFSYRLAPAAKFPAPLEDTNRVFGWIMAHADEYGFDTDNMFAVGDSAGGNDLGLYACFLTNPKYAEQFSFSAPEGLKLRGVALNCGCYEIVIDGSKENEMNTALMRDYLPEGGVREELDAINVKMHVTPAFPPAFVMTCTGDFLENQAEPLVRVLKKNGVRCYFGYYGDNEHSLGHVFHCNMKSAFAKQCNDDECLFFRGLM